MLISTPAQASSPDEWYAQWTARFLNALFDVKHDRGFVLSEDAIERFRTLYDEELRVMAPMPGTDWDDGLAPPPCTPEADVIAHWLGELRLGLAHLLMAEAVEREGTISGE